MLKECDVLIVGAATTGIYFGWLMAKKGHSVLVVDKEEREQVGQRLEVIHLDKETFLELNIPPPTEEPELIGSWRGIWVSRLPLFFQRMYKILESDGVQFEFSCNFKQLIYENDRIVGVKLEQENKEYDVHAKLVVDASGVACAVRSTLPENYGVETWTYNSTNRFFVILHYIKWLEPDEPHPVSGNTWPYYFVFFDPGYMGEKLENAIMGIIGPESFEKTEAIMEEFLESGIVAPFELIKKEYCSFPLTLPPYSLVADGFFCAGDSAATMNPIAARGIPETWHLCKNTENIFDAVLKSGEYVSRERLWEVNVKHFRGEGAELASVYMLSSFIHVFKEKELNFLFQKLLPILNPPDAEEEATEIKLSAGKILKVIAKVLGGIFTGKLSIRRIFKVIKISRNAGKLKKHYKNYPETAEDLDEWIKRTNELLELRKVQPRVFKTTSATYP